MEMVLWIFVGTVVGLAVRSFLPGPPGGGYLVAITLGIIGASMGGLLGALVTGTTAVLDLPHLLVAVLGALLVLLTYRSFALRAAA